MNILVTSDRYSRHLKRKYISVTLGASREACTKQQVGINVGILPSLLIFPLITLAFETCTPPTPVRKVSNTRTTHIWKTRGPLMVMTNARPTSLRVKMMSERPQPGLPKGDSCPASRLSSPTGSVGIAAEPQRWSGGWYSCVHGQTWAHRRPTSSLLPAHREISGILSILWHLNSVPQSLRPRRAPLCG